MRYENYRQAAIAENIPINVIKQAKLMGADGFDDHARINWDLAGPWIKNHYKEIEEAVQDSIDVIKKNRQKIGLQKDIFELEEAKGKFVERAEVVKHISSMNTATRNLLVTKSREYAPKLVGISSRNEVELLMASFVKDICEVMASIKL